MLAAGARAQQNPAPAVEIDDDDLGGGPEAGIWAIAQTTELGTRFAKIAVADERGRYVVPDLSGVRNCWTLPVFPAEAGTHSAHGHRPLFPARGMLRRSAETVRDFPFFVIPAGNGSLKPTCSPGGPNASSFRLAFARPQGCRS